MADTYSIFISCNPSNQERGPDNCSDAWAELSVLLQRLFNEKAREIHRIHGAAVGGAQGARRSAQHKIPIYKFSELGYIYIMDDPLRRLHKELDFSSGTAPNLEKAIQRIQTKRGGRKKKAEILKAIEDLLLLPFTEKLARLTALLDATKYTDTLLEGRRQTIVAEAEAERTKKDAKVKIVEAKIERVKDHHTDERDKLHKAITRLQSRERGRQVRRLLPAQHKRHIGRRGGVDEEDETPPPRKSRQSKAELQKKLARPSLHVRDAEKLAAQKAAEIAARARARAERRRRKKREAALPMVGGAAAAPVITDVDGALNTCKCTEPWQQHKIDEMETLLENITRGDLDLSRNQTLQLIQYSSNILKGGWEDHAATILQQSYQEKTPTHGEPYGVKLLRAIVETWVAQDYNDKLDEAAELLGINLDVTNPFQRHIGSIRQRAASLGRNVFSLGQKAKKGMSKIGSWAARLARKHLQGSKSDIPCGPEGDDEAYINQAIAKCQKTPLCMQRANKISVVDIMVKPDEFPPFYSVSIYRNPPGTRGAQKVAQVAAVASPGKHVEGTRTYGDDSGDAGAGAAAAAGDDSERFPSDIEKLLGEEKKLVQLEKRLNTPAPSPAAAVVVE